MSDKFKAMAELRGKGSSATALETALVVLWRDVDGYEYIAIEAAADLAALRARVAELEGERQQLFGVAVRAFNAVESLGVTAAELPGKLPELDHYLAHDLDDKLWDEIEAARVEQK